MAHRHQEVSLDVGQGGHGHDHSKCGGHGHDHGGHSHGGNGNSGHGRSHDDGHGHSHGGGGHGHDDGHGHSHGGGGHGHDDGHGHSHGGGDHGHDDGHGHSHGGGGHGHGRRKWYLARGMEIRCFVLGMTFIAWYSVFFWFNTFPEEEKPSEGTDAGNTETPKDTPINTKARDIEIFSLIGNNIFMTFIAVMCAFSYYVCTTVNNNNPTSVTPVHAPPTNSATCKTCNFWKPERTHHCSSCNACVLRMDHHCPWVVNCVGYKNHKSFVLFGLYLGIGVINYVFRSFSYLFTQIDNGEFWDFNMSFLIFWVITGFFIIMIGCMVCGLSLYHVALAANNLTTLESMGSANMRMPWNSLDTYEKKIINKYDLGMLANLYQFFGNTAVWWWWPTVPEMIHGSQHPESVDQPNPVEVMDLLRGKAETPEERIMKPRTLAEVDLENIFKIAEAFTADKHLQFFDRILEIGKRMDNTFKKPAEAPKPAEPKVEQQKKTEEDSETEKIENAEAEKKDDKEEVLIVDESGAGDKREGDASPVGAI